MGVMFEVTYTYVDALNLVIKYAAKGVGLGYFDVYKIKQR